MNSKASAALVTGGTKGIGAAIVHRFELSGASVATTARSDAQRFKGGRLDPQAYGCFLS